MEKNSIESLVEEMRFGSAEKRVWTQKKNKQIALFGICGLTSYWRKNQIR